MRTYFRMPAQLESDTVLRYSFSFKPVSGFKNNVPFDLIFLKLNIWLMELATVSKEPLPMRCPLSQLSSMKWITDV